MRFIIKRVVPPVPSQEQAELTLYAAKDTAGLNWTQNIEDALRFDDRERADQARWHASQSFNGAFFVEPEPVQFIHVLYAGQPFCSSVEGMPNEWPNAHVWVGLPDRDKATCSECQINAEKFVLTSERPVVRRTTARDKMAAFEEALKFLDDRISVKTCQGSMMDAVRDVQAKYRALKPHITV